MKKSDDYGHLYVISAPSGAGKTSLIRALCGSMPNIMVSISHTTRAPRANETPNEDYYFVDHSFFNSMIQEKKFIEYAEVFGNLYGTSHASVEQNLIEGKDIILELDWQGARQIQTYNSECICIFIIPPSREELERRLKSRGSDSTQVVEKRLEKVAHEIAHYHEFDYIIVNNHFDLALQSLQSIIHSHRLKASRQKMRYATLLKQLLS